MTTTTEPTTALATVPDRAVQIAKSGSFTIDALADVLAPALAGKKSLPAPKLPAPAELSPEAAAALGRIGRVFGKTRLDKRRPLTPAELKMLTGEAVTLSAAKGPIEKRLSEISETMRTHMDAAAEQAGLAFAEDRNRGAVLLHPATPRIQGGTAKGHYLLATPGSPHKVTVEGYEEPWEQRFTHGATEVSPEALLALYDSGKITRAEYLAFTREMRVLDETKISQAIGDPKTRARSLEILAAITTRKPPSAQLVSPKK